MAASFTAPVLFTLAEDLTQMDLHVNVDEADIGKIREGQKAAFTVAAYPNRTFTARITQARYGSSTTSGVVTYETILKVSNPDLSLRPGMTATADITVKQTRKRPPDPRRRAALHPSRAAGNEILHRPGCLPAPATAPIRLTAERRHKRRQGAAAGLDSQRRSARRRSGHDRLDQRKPDRGHLRRPHSPARRWWSTS